MSSKYDKILGLYRTSELEFEQAQIDAILLQFENAAKKGETSIRVDIKRLKTTSSQIKIRSRLESMGFRIVVSDNIITVALQDKDLADHKIDDSQHTKIDASTDGTLICMIDTNLDANQIFTMEWIQQPIVKSAPGVFCATYGEYGNIRSSISRYLFELIVSDFGVSYNLAWAGGMKDVFEQIVQCKDVNSVRSLLDL